MTKEELRSIVKRDRTSNSRMFIKDATSYPVQTVEATALAFQDRRALLEWLKSEAESIGTMTALQLRDALHD